VKANKFVKIFATPTSIVINSGAGNDRVTISGARGAIGIDAAVDGGTGNDRIQTAAGDDDVEGGDGADTILSGSGDDFVLGDAGNDNINAGHDDDQVYGGAGNDTLLGASGSDTLGGDNEDNLRFRGVATPARVVGDDSLNGGAGNDHLLGGVNSDFITDDENGEDTMTGGLGNDIFNARGPVSNNKMTIDDTITDEAPGDEIVATTWTNSTLTGTEQEIDVYEFHKHAVIRVYINGEQMDIQAEMGSFGFPVLHSHGAAGGLDTIHFHNVDPDRDFTIVNMFRTLGYSMDNNHIGQFRGPVTAETKFIDEPDSAFTPIADVANHAIRSTDARVGGGGTDRQEVINIYLGDPPG